MLRICNVYEDLAILSYLGGHIENVHSVGETHHPAISGRSCWECTLCTMNLPSCHIWEVMLRMYTVYNGLTALPCLGGHVEYVHCVVGTYYPAISGRSCWGCTLCGPLDHAPRWPHNWSSHRHCAHIRLEAWSRPENDHLSLFIILPHPHSIFGICFKSRI